MSRFHIRCTVFLASLLGFIGITNASGVLFSDGFESGDFSHTENGFQWGSSNTGGSPALIEIDSNRPKSGASSMLMRFGGTGLPNSWTEKRFSFTSNRQTELWVKFDLWVPNNLSLVNQGGGNNKFMAFYNGDYSSNFQVNFSSVAPNGIFSNSVADLQVHLYQNGAEISNDPYGSSHAAQLFSTSDLGSWVEIIMRVKCTSAFGVADGVMEFWKNGKKIYSHTDLPIWGRSGYNYMDGAYFLGWANTGFPSITDFYIDNVVFSNAPISSTQPMAPLLKIN